MDVHCGGGGTGMEEGRKQPSLSQAFHSTGAGGASLLCFACILSAVVFPTPSCPTGQTSQCTVPLDSALWHGDSLSLWEQKHILLFLQCPPLADLGAIRPRHHVEHSESFGAVMAIPDPGCVPEEVSCVTVFVIKPGWL